MRSDRRPTILLVEDSQDEEMLVVRALRRSIHPCQVVVAHTTEEALDFLFSRGKFSGRESQAPDVVITDLKVGAMGGAELVTAIRSKPETHLIPIVVFSGAVNDGDVENLYLRGANSFIEKPMDVDEFALTITRLATYWGLLNATAAHSKPVSTFPYPL